MVINTESYNWTRCKEYDTFESSALNETGIYITPLLPRFSKEWKCYRNHRQWTTTRKQCGLWGVVSSGDSCAYEFIAAETVCISPTHAHARKYSGMKWGGRY